MLPGRITTGGLARLLFDIFTTIGINTPGAATIVEILKQLLDLSDITFDFDFCQAAARRVPA